MTQETMNTANQPPEKRITVGNVTVSVWVKTILVDGVNKFVKSVTLQKSYKDQTGNWQNTSSLNASDLPRAILALQKAFEYLAIREEANA